MVADGAVRCENGLCYECGALLEELLASAYA